MAGAQPLGTASLDGQARDVRRWVAHMFLITTLFTAKVAEQGVAWGRLETVLSWVDAKRAIVRAGDHQGCDLEGACRRLGCSGLLANGLAVALRIRRVPGWAPKREVATVVSATVVRLCVALLVAAVVAAPLGACSRRDPAPDVSFLPTAAVKAEDKKAAFESAKESCLERARRKGISSVTRILLFKGKISESDYVECMEAKASPSSNRT